MWYGLFLKLIFQLKNLQVSQDEIVQIYGIIPLYLES